MNTAPQTNVIEVTPEIAQSYLERNTANRPVSARTVNELAKSIRAGEWQTNGESIKFDVTGAMIDGQHRCHAIIKSGCSILTFVSFDLPEDSFMTLDTGKKRNNADVLGILGYSNPGQTAATARFIVNFRLNALRSNELVTNQRLEVFLDENPLIGKSIAMIKAVKADTLVPHSVAAGLHYLMAERSPDDAEIFFRDLAQGSMLSASDPAFLLREKLLFYKQRVGAKLTRRELVAHIIKAWNYRRSGKMVKRLVWAKKSGEEFPSIQ